MSGTWGRNATRREREKKVVKAERYRCQGLALFFSRLESTTERNRQKSDAKWGPSKCRRQYIPKLNQGEVAARQQPKASCMRGGNEITGVGVGIRDAEARWKDASKAKKKKGRGACALQMSTYQRSRDATHVLILLFWRFLVVVGSCESSENYRGAIVVLNGIGKKRRYLLNDGMAGCGWGYLWLDPNERLLTFVRRQGKGGG
jgi:hypothetical protein